MKLLKVMLALLAIGFSTDSNAGLKTVAIKGDQSCGVWVKDRAAKDFNNLRDSALLIGYLSGAATYSGVDILESVDAESIYLWMDKYCDKNPLSDIYDGADKLFYELGKKKN